MKYTVVLPYVHEPYRTECLKNCKLSNLFLIDNTSVNRGIMKSHNMGIDKMMQDGSDWLIILSAAVRFGEKGGLDFIEQLEKTSDLVLEAAGVFGWHFIAFHRDVILNVGRWDENFTPYGYDDLDYSWRIQLAFNMQQGIQLWSKAIVDVKDTTMAHSIHLGKIVTQPEPVLREYWLRKWGSDAPIPTYRVPFNNEAFPVHYWPDAKNGGKWNKSYLV